MEWSSIQILKKEKKKEKKEKKKKRGKKDMNVSVV